MSGMGCERWCIADTMGGAALVAAAACTAAAAAAAARLQLVETWEEEGES